MSRRRSALFSMLALVVLFFACAAPKQISVPEQTSALKAERKAETGLRKHPLDQSEYRHLVLDNGLKVILVSDPRFNKSAASMVVEVGSLSNPRNRQGLAHFLEHMLFLGTEKYPGVDDYSSYLTENGGYNNAYTSGDHTSYFFEVNHDAYEGALDRFAQFFIAPLFTETYTERELNAVNSEHQKNLENDTWRTIQVQRTLYRKDHPEHMFSTGSLETLGGTTREELLNFYRTHYSANRMSLALLGKAPPDTLRQWAVKYFSQIPNKDMPRITYEPDYLPVKATFRLIQVEPVKDIRTLELEFPLPSFLEYYGSKPTDLLGNLIGHEGKGSLLSLLKGEGLATALSAGGYPATKDYGAFSIRMDLTPKGLENYREVVRLCLTYINMLKREKYPGYFFQEMRTKAKLDEIYTDRGEGSGYATRLALLAARYPLEIAERIPYLYEKEDAHAYRKILFSLRPDNMLVTLAAKGVPTTETEPYYGARYSYTEDGAFYRELFDLPPRDELHLPAPNPFMPTRVTIPDRPRKEGVVPARIIDEAGLVLYHSEDFEFLRPKVSLRYKIRFPKENMGLKFKVLLDTYTACVNESLSELAYPALLAGLRYTFADGYEGVYFSIDGFDESASRLFEHVLDHMQHLKMTDTTFEAIQDRIVRDLKNFPRQDAWRIVRFMNYEVLNAVSYRPEDRLKIVEKLTLNDVQAFAKTLYERAFIEALVHGNITADEAVALSRKLQTTLGIKAIAREATFVQTYLQQPEPEALRMVDQLEVNNSCFRRDYLIGPNTPRNRGIAMILNAFFYQPFFTELRTNQQLGYIVFGGAGTLSSDKGHLYCYFIIQSGTYPADVIEDRADAFIGTFGAQFEALPQEGFETLRAAAVEKLKQKEKTIAEKADKFNAQAFDFDGDFERDRKAIEAIEALTKADVTALLRVTLSKETRRMRTTLGFAREHRAQRPLTTSFENLDEWKKKRVYR